MNETVYDLAELRRNPVSRRGFLTRMTAAGLGVAAMALLAGSNFGCGSSDDANAGLNNDPVFPGVLGRNRNEIVLNYALTLELLEADLYRQALNVASGRNVAQPLDAGTGPSGNSSGGYNLAIDTGGLTGTQAQIGFLYLAQYAYVEAAHRDFLITVLQSFGAPTTVANRAGYQLPAGAGANLKTILQTIFAVEETGARAYLGAAPFMLFSSGTDKSLVQTAVAIHSTEARHTDGIGYALGMEAGPIYDVPGAVTGKRVTDKVAAPYSGEGLSEDTFGYYADPVDVLNAVKPFIVGA